MIKQLQSTRVCSVCGLKKPLVSFVELVGPGKGHTYGNICSECRRSGLDSDEHSGSGSRLQIDSKAKVKAEQDKKAQAKESSGRDLAEKIKKERTEAKDLRNEKKREEIDKLYREQYLKDKNQKKESQPDDFASKDQNKGFYQEKKRGNTEFQKQVTGQQLGKKTTGISADYIHKYVAATGRSADSLFGHLLGQFMRNKFQAQTKAAQAPGQKAKAEDKKVNPQTTFASTKEKAPESSKKETRENNTALDFMRKNFIKR